MSETIVPNFSNLLLCRGFNNYFNRTLKRAETLDEYEILSLSTQTVEAVNFNPGDGVSADHIIDSANESSPDYVVVYHMEGEGESEVSVIDSRWFVLEWRRTRKGQYAMKLRRDVVADNYESIRTADFFCEKGYLKSDDPLLLNGEGMAFNQIKKAEVPLKDETGMAWIVGYVARHKEGQEDEENISADVSLLGTGYETISTSDLPEGFPTDPTSSGSLYGIPDDLSVTFYGRQTRNGKLTIRNQTISVTSNINVSLTYKTTRSGSTSFTIGNETAPANGTNTVAVDPLFQTTGGTFIAGASEGTGGIPLIPAGPSFDEQIPNLLNDAWNQFSIAESIFNKYAEKYGAEQGKKTAYFDNLHKTDYILSFDGKILEVNGSFYRISVIVDPFSNLASRKAFEISEDFNDQEAGINFGYLNEQLEDIFGNYWRSTHITPRNIYILRYKPKKFIVTFEQVYIGTASTTLELSRNKLPDSPYDMFFMPYGELDYSMNSGSTVFSNNPFVNLAIGLAIPPAVSSTGLLYDLQLLPYCPDEGIRKMIAANQGKIILDGLTEGEDYSLIKIGTGQGIANGGALFWATNSKGSIDIKCSITVRNPYPSNEEDEDDEPFTNEEMKVANECDFYRLNSPNYNGAFDFIAAKNGGRVTNFKIDFEYKPQNPYIHVAFDFSNFYGDQYGDARGLICGGDFSLPLATDQWNAYQLQNKNYQAIFDRTIQNMDKKNELALASQRINGVIGMLDSTVQGALQGMRSGNQIYPGMGGAIGAAIGGAYKAATSTVKTASSIALGQEEYRENRDFAIDKFNFEVGNIQALPITLSRVSSFNPNNKIFPFIEYYTCTDRERETFKKKIQLNGVTVQAIGTINDFIGPGLTFLKGQIIRAPALADDAHILSECYDELNKGLFIYTPIPLPEPR